MRSQIVLIAASLGLLPVAGRAQEPGGAVACPSIQNDQERLACYDRAMRGAPRAAPAPQPSAAPAAAPTPSSTAAPAAAGAAAIGAAAATGNGAAAAAHTAVPAASSSISTAPHNPRNTTAATPAQPGAAPTFDPNTGTPTGIVPVLVVRALSRPGFGTEFTTDTGSVWIQTETKPLTLPKTPFKAELQPGKFGSTFLVLPDSKMGIRVRAPNK